MSKRTDKVEDDHEEEDADTRVEKQASLDPERDASVIDMFGAVYDHYGRSNEHSTEGARDTRLKAIEMGAKLPAIDTDLGHARFEATGSNQMDMKRAVMDSDIESYKFATIGTASSSSKDDSIAKGGTMVDLEKGEPPMPKLIPPTLAEAETAEIQNTHRDPPSRQDSLTSTVVPPPLSNLRRARNIFSEPGAVRVHRNPVREASNSTIQIGDTTVASSGAVPPAPQQDPVVDATLVEEQTAQQEQSPGSQQSPNLETVSAVPFIRRSRHERESLMTILSDYRVCSLITVLLLIASGLLIGLILANG